MIAAGKKNRLKTKYPMKLWPLRPATRAGQNAIAIQMTANKIHQRADMAASSLRVRTERCYLLPDGSAGTSDVAAPGRSAHHPGITPGGVIRAFPATAAASGDPLAPSSAALVRSQRVRSP